MDPRASASAHARHLSGSPPQCSPRRAVRSGEHLAPNPVPFRGRLGPPLAGARDLPPPAYSRRSALWVLRPDQARARFESLHEVRDTDGVPVVVRLSYKAVADAILAFQRRGILPVDEGR